MKATLISNENNVAKFNMDFPAEEFDGAVNKVYRKNRNRYQVNGFRRGKAPLSILERYYGEGLFFQDAINDLLNEHYPEAVDELDLEVVAQPEVKIDDVSHNAPLHAEISVQLFPVVEVKDYIGLDVDETEVNITDEDVDGEIEALRRRNARLVDADRPAENGDTLILDFEGFIGDDKFEGGSAEMQELKLGSGTFIPGFEEQLVGAVKGEKRDVNVTFPADYQSEEVAGKDAVFRCTVHDVKEEQLPDLDDEFAKDVSEYDTLEEFRESTRDNLEKTRKGEAEDDAKNALLKKLVEHNEVELPADMIESEIDSMMNNLYRNIYYAGVSPDSFFSMMGTTEDGYRESIRDEARQQAACRVFLRSVALQEGLEASDEEIDEEIGKLADQYGIKKEEFEKRIEKEERRTIIHDILVKKAVDLIYDRANVTYKEPPAPESAEAEKDNSEEGGADEPSAESETQGEPGETVSGGED